MRALLVSTACSPRAGAGAVRLDALHRLLPDEGWDVTVVATSHTGRAAAPPGGRVEAFSPVDWAASRRGGGGSWGAGRSRARRLVVPDPWIAWVPFAVASTGRGRLSAPPVDVVVSSSPNESSHVAGWLASRRLGVPWVADLRDPWWGNARRDDRPGRLTAADERLGRWVIGRASAITTASRPWAEQLGAAYPDLPVSFVMNGMPSERAAVPAVAPRRDLVHTGYLYGSSRLSGALLAALRRAAERAAATGATPRALDSFGPRSRELADLAAAAGATALVRQHGPVVRSRALDEQRAAGALVVLVGDNRTEAECIPAKVFEYMAARRPIVVVGPEDSEAARLVAAHRLGHCVGANDVDALTELLAGDELDRFVAPSEDALTPFGQRRMAGEFAGVMAHVVGSRA